MIDTMGDRSVRARVTTDRVASAAAGCFSQTVNRTLVDGLACRISDLRLLSRFLS